MSSSENKVGTDPKPPIDDMLSKLPKRAPKETDHFQEVTSVKYAVTVGSDTQEKLTLKDFSNQNISLIWAACDLVEDGEGCCPYCDGGGYKHMIVQYKNGWFGKLSHWSRCLTYSSFDENQVEVAENLSDFYWYCFTDAIRENLKQQVLLVSSS